MNMNLENQFLKVILGEFINQKIKISFIIISWR